MALCCDFTTRLVGWTASTRIGHYMSPRLESNQHNRLRSPVFYPLNYKGFTEEYQESPFPPTINRSYRGADIGLLSISRKPSSGI